MDTLVQLASATASATSSPDRKQAPFARLPDEIVEQILHLADPNAFASLLLLNRQFRRVSQRPYLYEAQLRRCRSYGASHLSFPTADAGHLDKLRRIFAREVKRNLFDSYRRPSETVVKLVSTSNSSSSCPGGEGLQFSFSPKGHHMLAYNSSRIYLLDLREKDLQAKREFKILRRPISVCISDEAHLLAVLSTEAQIEVYDLRETPPRRQQSILLDNAPRAIAMSSCGSVLAASYDSGIEVSSLNPNAMPTDRRSVKCDAVDSLSFSFDGTQILGTTAHSSPSTVVLTAPYYDPANQVVDDNRSAMWTTSILFPNTSHDCSHAVLLQNGSREEATWAFTYDRSFETFRAIRIEDLRNGTTYFTGPTPKATSYSKLLPSTLPTATYNTQMAAAGFHGKEIWVYGIPEDLDANPESALGPDYFAQHSGVRRRNSSQSALSRNSSTRSREAPAPGKRVPQWQILCDKLRNNFVSGYQASELAGVTNLKWVANYSASSLKERLVITAKGVTASRLATDDEDIDFIDGGRVTLLDFDYSTTDGTRHELTIELGSDDAEALEEEQRDLDTEVAIVRRRTVAQKRKDGSALLRAATTAGSSHRMIPPIPATSDGNDDDDPLLPRTVGRNPVGPRVEVVGEEDGDAVSIDEMEALDAPYAHTSPRSQTTLRRAATAAAINRSLHPRTADGRRIEYRRADGRAEHPHESDADNWSPPPPPYQAEHYGDLPGFLRAPAVTPLSSLPPLPSAWHANFNHAPPPTSATLTSPFTETFTIRRRQSRQRTASDSTTYSSRPRIEDFVRPEDIARPRSSPVVWLDSQERNDLSSPDTISHSPPTVERPRLAPAEDSSPDESNITSATGGLVSSSQTLENPDMGRFSFGIGAADTATAYQPTPLPVLDTQIPSSHMQDVVPKIETTATVRRLSNVQTWPLAPQPIAATESNGGTQSAIVSEQTVDERFAHLPPAPSSDQIDRMNKRISLGLPRKVSGGVPARWSVQNSNSLQSQDILQHGRSASASTMTRLLNPDEDRPLIISTPSGVSGALDGPSEKFQPAQGHEPQILAPVPQRPRRNIAFNPRPTPALEPIYSPAAVMEGSGSSQPQPQQQRQRKSYFPPAWLVSSSSLAGRSSAGISRKPSRAERSAAKNMHDARSRGWTPKTTKAKKKKQQRNVERSGNDTGEWTDISPTSVPKEKKCIVM